MKSISVRGMQFHSHPGPYVETHGRASLQRAYRDYQTPANEMNELISHYKTQLKALATRRNQGKDVHTEDPITVPS